MKDEEVAILDAAATLSPWTNCDFVFLEEWVECLDCAVGR